MVIWHVIVTKCTKPNNILVIYHFQFSVRNITPYAPGRFLGLHHPEDLPELGSLACADDDADAVAVDDQRPLEGHVVHVVHLQPARLRCNTYMTSAVGDPKRRCFYFVREVVLNVDIQLYFSPRGRRGGF